MEINNVHNTNSTNSQFEKKFIKKHDIENRTLTNCKNYLAEFKKSFPESYREYFTDDNDLQFKNAMYTWVNDNTRGKSLISSLDIYKSQIATARYSALYSSKGKECDDWLDKL